jgi:hypothetical protein
LKRLVVLSAVMVFTGLMLLLPASQLWSLLTAGNTSPTSGAAFRAASASGVTDNTGTIESLAGFGAVGVGLVLEVFSLFTDVGAAAPSLEAGVPVVKVEEKQP